MKTNSNSYTIIYSIIIVVIVAFLLAFVSTSLREKQDKNVALDKKKQILYSLNIRGLNDADAEAKYKEVIVADEIIDEMDMDDMGRMTGGEEEEADEDEEGTGVEDLIANLESQLDDLDAQLAELESTGSDEGDEDEEDEEEE